MSKRQKQPKSVLVTGASTGIGLSCCEELAQHGWRVFAGARREEDMQRLKTIANVTPLHLDVTFPQHIEAAVRAVDYAADSKLDALINNAGIAVGGPLETVSMDNWRLQFEVNFFGSVAVTQAFLPLLRNARGRIINMSSISGRLAAPLLAPYASSKFAIEAMSDALRLELKPQGIGVVVIEPGPVTTPIWDKAERDFKASMEGADPAKTALYEKQLEALQRNVEVSAEEAIPARDVARLVRRALITTRPRSRYAIGKDAWLPARLLPMLPDWIRDWLVGLKLG